MIIFAPILKLIIYCHKLMKYLIFLLSVFFMFIGITLFAQHDQACNLYIGELIANVNKIVGNKNFDKSLNEPIGKQVGLKSESKKLYLKNEEYFLTKKSIDYYNAFENLDENVKSKLVYVCYDLKFKLKSQVEELGLPEEFCYLPVAISALNYSYHDNYRGYGIWGLQYLPAIRFGLVIDSCYDERLDLKLSTKASLLYLQHLHSKYNSWDHAITAFCCGPAKLNKILTDTSNFDIVTEKLLNEGNVFYKLLAFAYWANNRSVVKYDYVGNEIAKDTVDVNSRMSLLQISDYLSIDLSLLKSLNPMFLCNIINGQVSPKKVFLPLGYANKFISNYESITHFKDSIYFPENKYTAFGFNDSSTLDDYNEIIYKVVFGDNLGKIAQKYGVTISDIQEWNNIKGTNIYIDQQLSIFVNKSNLLKVKNKQENNNSENLYGDYDLYEVYEVKEGDSLYSIVKKYKWVSIEDLMNWNDIKDPSKLRIGQKLRILKKK